MIFEETKNGIKIHIYRSHANADMDNDDSEEN